MTTINPTPAQQGDARFCGLCGKTEHEVPTLISAAVGYICNECVAICAEIIQRDAAPSSPTPAESAANDTEAKKWAFGELKKQLQPPDWTVGEYGNYFGFFCWGWEYKAAFDKQFAPPERTRVEGEQVAHRCSNGEVRPYPPILCSMCQQVYGGMSVNELCEAINRAATISDSARRAAEEIANWLNWKRNVPQIAHEQNIVSLTNMLSKYFPAISVNTGGFTCDCCGRNCELRINGKFCNECAGYRAAAPAANDAESSLLSKITTIADIGSAEEFGDALERLKSIRQLIDTTTTTKGNR